MSWDLFEILDSPIAYHRSLAKLCGSVQAGLMLGQAIYWSKRTSNPEGWFYKVQDEWEEETCLTRREQETARKILRSFDFWEEDLRGVPAKLYFRVSREKLQTSMAESAKLDCRKPPNKKVGKRQTSITEITSETTTETTEREEASPLKEEKQEPEPTSDIDMGMGIIAWIKREWFRKAKELGLKVKWSKNIIERQFVERDCLEFRQDFLAYLESFTPKRIGEGDSPHPVDFAKQDGYRGGLAKHVPESRQRKRGGRSREEQMAGLNKALGE